MQKLLIFLIVTLIVRSSSAEVILLEKGQTAPFQGMLFPPETAKELKNTVIERDFLREINFSQSKMIDLYKQNQTYYNEEKQLLLDQNDKLAKNLNNERTVTTWEKIGYFGLGVIATSATVYLAAKIVKLEFK